MFLLILVGFGYAEDYSNRYDNKSTQVPIYIEHKMADHLLTFNLEC
jgi:hypothetical protein